MAHEIRLKVDTAVASNKDFVITVKTDNEGKLGELLISKGNIEWLSSRNHVNKKRLSWAKFASLMESEGVDVKIPKTKK